MIVYLRTSPIVSMLYCLWNVVLILSHLFSHINHLIQAEVDNSGIIYLNDHVYMLQEKRKEK